MSRGDLSELAEARHCLCLASRRAARAITREFDRALRPHGLRSTQFSVLAVLSLAGPQRMGQLAAILSADRTTVTRNLGVLEGRSLVVVRRGADARERVAEVTDAGREVLRAAFPAWRRTQRELTEALGGEAAEGLRRVAAEAASEVDGEDTGPDGL